MVDVVNFPKKCPHCSVILQYIRKMHCSWLECANAACVFITSQTPTKMVVRSVTLESEPFPYTYAYNQR